MNPGNLEIIASEKNRKFFIILCAYLKRVCLNDRFGREIRFTEERWKYIASKRPIMSKYRRQFIDTIMEPEFVKKSVPEVVLYLFVLTGYISDRIKKGDIIWKKD